MGLPLGRESQALLAILEDGEWHPWAEVMAALAKHMAPGKALRRYEDKRVAHERHYGPRVHAELSEDEKILSGQRTLANVTINSMKKRYIEIVDVNGDRKIRKRKTLEEEVSDRLQAEHSQEHTMKASSSGAEAPASTMVCEARQLLVSETTLRAIVAEEVAKALDQFQHGMQSWMGERFAELGYVRPRAVGDPRVFKARRRPPKPV